MEGILMTPYGGSILGPIAKVLGVIINFIFEHTVPNVGLAIILFTIVIYMCLLPLTIKQQKFSKLSAIINPEVQAIQAKYKGKNDNESMQKQNEEVQAVYKKYGVSPTGSCVQLLIQMPILFALYRVIYSIPAYITQIKDAMTPLADAILADPKGVEVVQSLNTAKQFSKSDFTLANTIIDVLNRASTSEWTQIRDALPSVASQLDTVHAQFLKYYNFLGLNIADSPQSIIMANLKPLNIGLIIGAVLVPALAALTQWLNVLFMPQAANQDDKSAVASSMKTMNIMMPLMSAVFCLTLPAGMGIYWIASAVIRSIQQVVINKHFDKMDLDEIIQQNAEKIKKEEAKAAAKQTGAPASSGNSSMKDRAKINKQKIDSMSVPAGNGSAKEGSLASKANLVRKYNEDHKD